MSNLTLLATQNITVLFLYHLHLEHKRTLIIEVFTNSGDFDICMYRTFNFMHNNFQSMQENTDSCILTIFLSLNPVFHDATLTHTHSLNVFLISNPKACKMYTIPCRSFSKGQKRRRETRATFSGALGRTDGECEGQHRRTSTKRQLMMHLVYMRVLLQHIVPKTGLQNCLAEKQSKTLKHLLWFFPPSVCV